MQLKTFKIFVDNIVREGNRLQKHNINGERTVKGRFTTTQYIAFSVAVISIFIIHNGFPNVFAGYTISFLGIFIGLFSSALIFNFGNSRNLFDNFEKKDQLEQVRIRQIRNYIVQFTGLASYAILLALVTILLLLVVLLDQRFQTDIFNYSILKNTNDINFLSIVRFIKVFGLIIQRFFIAYFLINFFFITIFSTTSYFSYLSSEYKKMKPPND